MKIELRELRRAAGQRPAGYLDEVLAAGKLVGDDLLIEPEAMAALVRKYSPERLSVFQKARNLAESLSAWASAGFPIAIKSLHSKRIAQCKICTHWDSQSRECRLCGCGEAKLWLETEHCPDFPPRW